MASVSARLSFLGCLSGILFCFAASAQTISERLVKLASESPDRVMMATLRVNKIMTTAELMKLTQNYSIHSMKLTGRQFTTEREGIMAIFEFSSLASPEQQLQKAKCSFNEPLGFFSYSAETMEKMKEQLPENRKTWWFTDGLVRTTAAELHRLSQNSSVEVTNASWKEGLSDEQVEVLNKKLLDSYTNDSCQ